MGEDSGAGGSWTSLFQRKRWTNLESSRKWARILVTAGRSLRCTSWRPRSTGMEKGSPIVRRFNDAVERYGERAWQRSMRWAEESLRVGQSEQASESRRRQLNMFLL